jgi:phosphoribosylglycinamide formyltransferase-1
MTISKRRYAVLISGGASTGAAISKACCPRGELIDVEVVVAIASNSKAGEELRKLKNPPPIIVVRRKDFETREAFGDEINRVLGDYSVDFFGQHGWEPYTPANVVAAYAGRAINQHPGWPKYFGGPKMSGIVVPCAQMHYSQRTGDYMRVEPVAHWLTTELDGGDVIKKGSVTMLIGEDCQSLYARVKKAEHGVQICAIRDLCYGTVHEVTTQPLAHPELLEWAKQEALNHKHPD